MLYQTKGNILFLVNTPLQLVNAAIIAHTEFNKMSCDIYYTENICTAALNLVDKCIFSEGHEIKHVKDMLKRTNVLTRIVVRVKNALDINDIIANLPSNVEKYDRVFLSGISLRNCEFYYAIKRLNPRVTLSLYEEGVYEYVGFGKKNYLKILFSKFFFGRYYLYDADTLYVHKPDFVINAWNNILLKEITTHYDNMLIKHICTAFDYNERIFPEKRVCTILEQEFYTDEENAIQRELIDIIENELGNENVIIKLHPRSMKDKYGNKHTTQKTSVPFEIIAMNEQIMDNMFISVTSSAIANLYLMLDAQPDIVMLNNLFPVGMSVNKDYDIFLKKIKASYRKNNFVMPKTRGELTSTINRLRSGYSNED